MSACGRIEPLLHGYHDGELGAFERWRVRRHLERCWECEMALGRLARVGSWVREALAPEPDVDLWDAIGPRLGSVDARVEAERRAAPTHRRSLPQLLGPVGAGAGLVAAAVAGFVLLWPEPPQAGVVRSLYALDQPVMVIDEADQDTIIWVMDQPPEKRTEWIRHDKA